MADSDVPITAGSGTKIDTRTVGAGTDEHRQVVVIGDPSTAADVASADATNGLDVDVTRLKIGSGLLAQLTSNYGLDSVADSGKGALGVVVMARDPATGTLNSPAAPSNDSLSGLTLTGAGLMGYNGSSWDRVRVAGTGRLQVDATVSDGSGSLTVDGTVDVGTLPGSLAGKAEDVASGPGDVGLPILGVRNDTPTALTDTNGDYTMIAVDKYGRVQTAPVRSLPKSIQVSGSIGITTAAVWNDKAVWVVPSNFLFAPKMARAAVTTAGTRTLVLAGKQLATFNPGTNAFTATGSVSSPDFYDRLFYRVATTHSATADTMTATYVDQDGNAGNATGGLVIAASAAGGSWFEFILAAGDFGVRSVSAVADTAAPTSVVDEIWGFRTLLEDLGPANTPHIAYLGEGLQIPAAESVVILFNAAATTAQQRFASVLGDLVAA